MTDSAAATTRPPIRAVPPAEWIDEVAARRRGRCQVRVVSAEPGTRPSHRSDPRLAVVVITHDRREELVENLGRLEALVERPRVVVVDNASTDGTAEAVRAEHPWVDLVVLGQNAAALGRNVAIDMLDETYVAFADDDTWWAPGSLSGAADVLDAHPDVAVVTATIVVEPAGTEDPVVADMRVSALPDEPGMPGHPLLSVLAGGSMMRRSAFLQVGGFEPRFHIGGEEELLSVDLAAAGWALRHIPDVLVHHHASRARDPHRRRANGIRNTLWFTWLRRPWPDAVRRSWWTLRGAPLDKVTVRAVVEALVGAPWVFRERRRLPEPVVEGLRLLDAQQLGSVARRYVS